MPGSKLKSGESVVLLRENFGALFDALRAEGYKIIGPTVQDGAIVYDEINSPDDLPAGWGDLQEPGKYRLRRRSDQALFGYVVGPHSWKRFLFPPHLRMWRAVKNRTGFQIIPDQEEPPRMAFLGVRPCELQAIAIQDTIFKGTKYVDPVYQGRRHAALIIAVNCAEPAGTCFCTSMKTGPRALAGFDIALTELLTDGKHRFLLESGSVRGVELLRKLPTQPATEEDRKEAEAVTREAAGRITRQLETEGLRDLLLSNLEHPRWEAIADRCLACANCTMVCPTCFCSTVEDTTDLVGNHAERWRRWDSCFNLDFSYIHGGSVRQSTMSRYRQWMTHKLASWVDQFGTFGCVGCGRCITWCPVGIDITEEARQMRQTVAAGKE
ncbi:MAG: sulfite reductase subunit A [Candidatus Hydrogenedentota bacterium]|jgi:formate hydrogenlyase subunit 6/NADH:ubiquinone oxidoreductase subunit I|uniref:Anaerobic sulfite reductase subunit A n=1 Tax=Sumerlaea chitinivorans TaxID=2250252 RepID=A0A2Z4YA20_SUMC1|nr:Anaerobic sulfite reductase subunit A [Candidatus Sumerlaea chitinivorans]MCX7963189.1 4Fe-4S dicluster domain-containing protein [Candidatus Sumerlaea chitinivorans]RMH25040.1 MAG: sulfite reductase subunit A [Candidatus Hydrogenedentota bacterium]GIX44717.1 MAG: 4Fe-4S ferredoxin [Candidatus Sumerlaea sp.]